MGYLPSQDLSIPSYHEYLERTVDYCKVSNQRPEWLRRCQIVKDCLARAHDRGIPVPEEYC